MTRAAPIMAPVDGRQSETARCVGRGTARLLRGLGLTSVFEMPLASGRRADIVSLSRKGEVWIVEIKSSLADLRADSKWTDYRSHCDRLFFAAPPDLPAELFPGEAGFICADAHGADMLREAPEHKLAPATRRAMTLRFAHLAAARLHGLHDPDFALPEII